MRMATNTEGCACAIRNGKASLTVDPFGGAIVDFRLLDSKINPLSFRFTRDEMPLNNRTGAPYQGHFLCLGRWGQPSAGEIKAGVPDHGHFANTMWTCSISDHRTLKMGAESHLEGMRIDRTIRMDGSLALYTVRETVTNINPLGRLYNMVQHPTLAAPFLNNRTRIQCSALKGFHYKNDVDPEKFASNWPYGMEEDMSISDLRSCDKGVTSVFSFTVDHKSPFGWITAYSPDVQLLIGYIWPAEEYPWINLWKCRDNDTIKYCGLEFGTTGIHRPFAEILRQGKSSVFNTDTLEYIDAGSVASRRYISFLMETPVDFTEVEAVHIHHGCLSVRQRDRDSVIEMRSPLLEGVVTA